MSIVYPERLQSGDNVGVIAPANALTNGDQGKYERAVSFIQSLGVELVFGPNAHIEKSDSLGSTSISARLEDLHWAYETPEIRGIICAAGGYNSIQLLDKFDWRIASENPKRFFGFSDATVLQSALGAVANQVSYHAPNFLTTGTSKPYTYTRNAFRKGLFYSGWTEITPSAIWSDDEKIFMSTGSYKIIREGNASGQVRGGNLGSLFLTQGTPFFAYYNQDTILFVEDDDLAKEWSPHEFDRRLRSVFMQPGNEHIKGLVIGRFQPKSHITHDLLKSVISSFDRCNDIPVVAGVDFGHTNPKTIFPIHGECELYAEDAKVSIKVRL